MEQPSTDPMGFTDVLGDSQIQVFPKPRRGGHYSRLYLFQIVRHSSETGKVSAAPIADRDHVKDPLITMPDREDGEQTIVRLQSEWQISNLRRHVRVSEHDAFRRSSRSGCIYYL